MYGIISVLDGTHYRIVQEIWTAIDQTCGPRSLVPHPFPHFTYQTSDDYDLRQLDGILQSIAAESTPFTVRTFGLGIFSGDFAVYIPVPRFPRLDRYHAQLWAKLAQASRTPPHAFRSPEEWVPHITLALGPQIRDKVPRIVDLLYRRDLAWSVEVNNLTVVYEDETHKELIGRFDFPSAADPPPPLES